MKVASLEIELMAGIARLQRDMDKANTVVGRSMQNIERHVQRVQRAFGALGLGLSIGVMLRQARQLADAWQGMENRLRLVTNNSTQLSRSLDDVYRIAQRTSAGLDATSQVYQRFAQNAGALGISMGQVASLSETVSKAVAISGASAQAADAALMQFGQALASGVLRGEEFNSIMEQTPGLMQALADGMGVPLGQMRALAQQGKITGDVIVAALANAAGAVDERFNTRIMTVSQSWTMLNNALTRYVGEMSGATGASSGVAEMIAKISRAIDSARSGLADLNREIDGLRVFGGLVADAWEAVNEFGQNFQRMLGTSEKNVRSLGDNIVTSFVQSFLSTAKEVDALYDTFAGAIAALGAGFRTLGENIAKTFEWGFNKALASFSGLTVAVSDWLNSTFNTRRFNFTLADDPGDLRLKSLREEVEKARKSVEGTLGAYDALARRVGDVGIWRAAEEAMAAYTEEVENSGEGTKQLGDSTDNTKKKISDAAKAAQQFEQQRRAYLRSQYQEVSNLADQADALEDQVRYYGLSESALNDLTIARLREQQAALTGIEGAEEEIAIRERMIEQYQRIGLAMQGLEQKEAEKAAWESWSRDVEQIFQQVGQSLTDAIFEGGKSGRELVKDLFKTLTLRVLINPVMNSIQGAVTNSLGGMFGLQNPQQGGMMGTVSNLGSAYNAASGGLTGNISNVANWVGEKAGSTALQSFASGLSATFGFSAPVAATGGVASLAGVTAGPGLAASLGSGASGVIGGSAAGIGSAIGAALPWVGGALAIGSLLGGDLFGGGPPKTRHGQRSTSEWIDGRIQLTGMDSRQSNESQVAAAQAAQAAVTQANALFTQLGIDAAFDSFYAIMESSVLGDRQGVASGGTLRIGDQLRQVGVPQASDMTLGGFGGWSEADMLPRLATDVQLTVLEAFQQLGDTLPPALSGMLKDVSIRALDEAGAQQLAQRFSALTEGTLAFMQAADVMPHLQKVSFDAAAGLVQLAGGVESLMAAEQSYYQNFYTEAERHGHAVDQLTKALAGAGIQMPALVGSVDEMLASYRALVDAQDVNTEAGRKARWALIQASGAFADVAKFAGQAAVESQRLAQEQARIDKMRWDDAVLAGDEAYSALTRSVAAEKTRLQREADAIATALRDSISAASTTVSELTGLTGRLTSTVQRMAGQLDERRSYGWAQDRVDRALSVAKLTGVMPQGADFEQALQIVSQPSEGLYSSFEEYQVDFLKTAHTVSELNELAEGQLSTEKRALKALEGQLQQSQEWYQAEMQRLDATLDYWRQQIDLATGTYEAELSQTEAIKAVEAAIANIQLVAPPAAGGGGGGGGGGTGGWTPGNLPAGAENLTAAERYVLYNEDLLKDYSGSGKTAAEYAAWHWNTYGQYEDRDVKLASFDVGTNRVPHDMLAMVHRDERIIPAADNRALMQMLSGGGNQGSEIRLLQKEIEELRAMLATKLDEGNRSTREIARTNRQMTEQPAPVMVTNVVPTVAVTPGT